MESALVQAGYVESFAALDRLIYGSSGAELLQSGLAGRAAYYDAAGKTYNLSGGIIDSGGHRTSEVYAWTRRPGSIVVPAKGAKGRKTQPVTVGKIDTWPGTNKPIPGGLQLYHIDTHYHKDALSGKLAVEPGDPGSFWLHSGYTAGQLAELARDPAVKLPGNLDTYARHMCVEYRNEKGLWEQPEGKRQDLWDCEVNGLALAMYLGIQYRKSTGQPTAAPVQPMQSQSPAAGRATPGWFQNRR
jgi:phage terminase large subunit GpA-like protein